jgi:hypothetical protein
MKEKGRSNPVEVSAGAQPASEALCWAESAASFVQAAIAIGASQNLEEYPPNVGGLKGFMDQAYVEQMNGKGYLNPIFDERDPEGYLEPKVGWLGIVMYVLYILLVCERTAGVS